MTDTFLAGLQKLDLSLSDHQFEQLMRYRQELLDWNTRMNLTAITDPQEVLVKHFLDSLSLLMVPRLHKDEKNCATPLHLLDIGAGAGFPGIVLKIVRPHWQITLLESTGKKVRFMQHIIEMLQLGGITSLQGRAEELAHKDEYCGVFDVVTARAVAQLPVLLQYAAPYCRMGKKVILFKKGALDEELAQGKRIAQKLGLVLQDDIAVTLPGLADGRRLLVWQRRSGKPKGS